MLSINITTVALLKPVVLQVYKSVDKKKKKAYGWKVPRQRWKPSLNTCVQRMCSKGRYTKQETSGKYTESTSGKSTMEINSYKSMP